MYTTFPILHITAALLQRGGKENERAQGGGGNKKADVNEKMKKYYDCPVYKYPKRSDRYLIFRVYLKPEGNNYPNVQILNKNMTPAIKWKLSGVSLLCSKD